ncbi:hypothetical protein [Sulfoacidibacillus thermotolerans]|uniref:Holin n=1 Tax=Sulfoacidibacillus thermotolerans TaxID=1765684 RepID=A0A2U3D647_SULT2|nr:hypothetical protein [Sulfoacidibacillus thermotolerans]PWI56744.1 hypothetical protein BM613_12275 [Sulfoacidibacillus thermotolerans]
MEMTLFSQASLHTLAGTSLAVLVIVQAIKELPFIRQIPTQPLALLVGMILLLILAPPIPPTRIKWATDLLNGLLSGFVAIGGWHVLVAKKTKKK